MNILLGVTGSVAATLAPKLLSELEKIGEVKVILTKSAQNFVKINTNRFFTKKVFTDEDEYDQTSGGYSMPGDEILHIELRKWADVLVIAPITANTIAKIAHGMADNLLTNTVLAWDLSKPVIIAPAMNTNMWENPVVQANLLIANYLKLRVVEPTYKTLACGDTGIGAMADISSIVEAVNAISNK